MRVHPTLVPSSSLLANVQGAMNAVMVQGDAVGPTVYYGAGAGELPTASAVVADLVDVARVVDVDHAHRVPYLAFQQDALVDTPILPMADVLSSYYLRLRVEDRPGVLADVSRLLATANISIGSMFQEPAVNGETDIIFLLHEAREGDVDEALVAIQALDFVRSPVIRLRVENL